MLSRYNELWVVITTYTKSIYRPKLSRFNDLQVVITTYAKSIYAL